MIPTVVTLVSLVSIRTVLLVPLVQHQGEPINPSCGQHCVYIAARVLACDFPLSRLHSLVPLDGAPRSLAELQNAVKELGLVCEPVEWPRDGIPLVVSPTIIHVVVKGHREPHHFVIALPYDMERVVLVDHPQAPIVVPWEEIHRIWTGRVLHIAKNRSELASVRSAVLYGRLHRLVSWWLLISVVCLLVTLAVRNRPPQVRACLQ
jgi:ABC-type bacteriocin/lantibiotic exporter with double-glycine peptidase domain